MNCRLIIGLSLLTVFLPACELSGADAPKLPLPKENIPDLPPYPPLVVTAGGKRLLLNSTDGKLVFDSATGQLVSNKPGWWFINYPLDSIAGLQDQTPDQICQKLFSLPRSGVKNWYFCGPGPTAPEPPPQTGPAPIVLTPNPMLFVDTNSPSASDMNDGTAAHPLKTISGAIPHLVAGSVVRVLPGIYRELPFFPTSVAGTPEKPIVVDGVRDSQGDMPVITGNDASPTNAWKPVDGYPGVYRAPFFTKMPGPASVDGVTQHEVSWLEDLKGGDDLINFGSTEMLHPKTAEELERLDWHTKHSDPTSGVVHLGDSAMAKPSVYYASSWVWVDAPSDAPPAASPDQPRVVNQLAGSASDFRFYRITALGFGAQNRMRMWVNEQPMPSAYVPGMPRPSHDTGIEHVQDFTLHEGWNHLVFLLDTTQKPADLAFNFHWLGKMISSAQKPADLTQRPPGTPSVSVTEWNVAGPYAATPDNAVYVRLQGDADPNAHVVDMAARDYVVQIQTSYLHLRGFEIRDGASYFQNGQLVINCAQGVLVEGCRFTGAENKSILAVSAFQNQLSAPNVLLGNWVESPGVTGISIPDASEPPRGTKADGTDEDTTMNGRMRVWSEYNRVINNNASGYSRWDESGGFKSLLAVGCLYLGNEIIGGDGPGMWFDWENYNNRIEGNLFLDPIGFAVGIEASPGPNLVANNLIVGNRHGGGFFGAAICTWSSNGMMAVNNTMDGRWTPSPDQGMFGSGVGNFMMHEGPSDRGTAWGSLPLRSRAMVDNLSVGYPPLQNIYSTTADSTENYLQANYTDISWNSIAMGGGVQDPKNTPFCNYMALDYRLIGDSSLGHSGVADKYTGRVTHDFYGLPRFDDSGRAVGALRVNPTPIDATKGMLEVEKSDETFLRGNELIPTPKVPTLSLADAIALSVAPIEKLRFYPDLRSIGGHADAAAHVPVTWSSAILDTSDDFDEFDRLLQADVWKPDEAALQSDGNTYKLSNGAVILRDDWGMRLGGRSGLICTATDSFRALVYVHPIDVQLWGGDKHAGRFFLVKWHGDDPPEVLWRTDKTENFWPVTSFCGPVDVEEGDKLGVGYDSTCNGSGLVDFRVGLLKSDESMR